ncbi:MAG: hypothetical protein RugAbin2_02404 [Rugosibacter sp.]|nr:hypothetical protein [Rugosibacter sp.]
MNTDLFGDVPVTLRDLELWLFKVPRLPHYHRSRSTYAEQWNVVSKIKREKLSGQLAKTYGDEGCEFCGQTLCAVSPEPTISPQAELDRLKRRVSVLEMVLLATTLPARRAPHGAPV